MGNSTSRASAIKNRSATDDAPPQTTSYGQLSVKLTLDPHLARMLDQADSDAIWSKLLRLEGLHKDQLDLGAVHEDVKRHGSDNSIDPNANASISDSRRFHVKEVSETLTAHQKLLNVSQFFTHVKSMYGPDIATDLFSSWVRGDVYVHDPCYLLVPYCYSMSVAPIVQHGVTHNPQLVSSVPQRARSFIGQVAETVISLSQELAGAVAIADIFPYYTYYLRKAGVSHLQADLPDRERVVREIENDFQSLVHILNASHRFCGQSAFTNVSIFDRPSLEHLFGDMCFPDGTMPDLELVMDVQKVFCDWFARGQCHDAMKPYPFPIVTLNIKVDESKHVLDQDTFDYFCRLNQDGLFNIFVSSSNKLASCCRVINNLDVHMSIFGDGGVNIGSLRVVTTNLARIGHLTRQDMNGGAGACMAGSGLVDRFIQRLQVQLEKCRSLLLAHRSFIQAQIARGACPFFHRDDGFMFMERFFLTFGINGLSEGLDALGLDITTDAGLDAAKRILAFISDFANSSCDVERRILFNVEQVPGESLAVKHAKKDRMLYGTMHTMYANQFVPLWRDVDVEDRMRVEGCLTRYMSGGSITHINLTDRIQSPEQMKRLLMHAIRCDCEHLAVNYTFNECQAHHITISGQASSCPMCGLPICQRYTRIVGYFTPVSSWGPERRDEFLTRKFA